MVLRTTYVGPLAHNNGTFSDDDENVDHDVYERLRPGTGPLSTVGNTNTLAHRLCGRGSWTRIVDEDRGRVFESNSSILFLEVEENFSFIRFICYVI